MEAIGAILSAVRSKSGVDFSCYRAPTVQRRILNRMLSLSIKDFESYGDLVQQSDAEVQQLIARITIKVSRFYRNPAVFDMLRHAVLPGLHRPGRPLRVWSAGCGRGEEAYTLGMLLVAAALEGAVTATDVDAFALDAAAAAIYPSEAAADLPRDLRERYLKPLQQPGADRVRVAGSVASRVTFQQADLAAPWGAAPRECDLVCCRNVLIYWSARQQRQMLRSLVASLRVGGVLCLGEAEWPDAGFARCLEPVVNRLRIFRKVAEEVQP